MSLGHATLVMVVIMMVILMAVMMAMEKIFSQGTQCFCNSSNFSWKCTNRSKATKVYIPINYEKGIMYRSWLRQMAVWPRWISTNSSFGIFIFGHKLDVWKKVASTRILLSHYELNPNSSSEDDQWSMRKVGGVAAAFSLRWNFHPCLQPVFLLKHPPALLQPS